MRGHQTWLKVVGIYVVLSCLCNPGERLLVLLDLVLCWPRFIVYFLRLFLLGLISFFQY